MAVGKIPRTFLVPGLPTPASAAPQHLHPTSPQCHPCWLYTHLHPRYAPGPEGAPRLQHLPSTYTAPRVLSPLCSC